MLLIFLLAACQPQGPADPTTPSTSPVEATTSSGPTGEEGARVARLSHVQYQNTVVDLLYLPDDFEDVTEHFVGAAVPSWFENDRDVLDVDPTLWLQYQAAAEQLSLVVASDSELLNQVAPSGDRDTFVEAFGLRAFRRPLKPSELTAYAALFDEGASIFSTSDPFADGVHAVVAGMLQSPHFLYRGLGYGGPGDGEELEDYELAAKLSYALWNTMPDNELLEAAAAGLTDASIEAQVQRMIRDERGKATVLDLHRQWLDVDRYQNVYRTKDERYDDYEKSTPRAMEIEVFAYVERIFYEGGTVEDMFSSRRTQVESKLAAIYGVEGIEDDGDNSVWVDVTLPADERAGVFTLLGWLALQSDGDTEDLIHRGAYVNHSVLCVDVPAPAVMVPPLPVDEEGLSLRERIEEHTATCGGECHTAYINPVGFAFGYWDAAGTYRTRSGDHVIDTSGAYEFDEGEVSWDDGVTFLEHLSVSPQVHRCYLSHLLSYAEGRQVEHTDDEVLDDLMMRSLDGEPVLDLLGAIVTAPSFRQRP